VDTKKLVVKVVILVVALILFWFLWVRLNMGPIPIT